MGKLALILLSVPVIVLGCSDELPSDPVSSYAEYIRQVVKSYDKQRPSVIINDSWKCAVKKTESSVSPLIGTCELLVTTQGVVFGTHIEFHCIVYMTHDWQEETWKQTKCSALVQRGTIIDGDRDEPALHVDALTGETLDLTSFDLLPKALYVSP